MQQEVKKGELAYTWKIKGNNLIYTIYYPSLPELEKLSPWEQAFWKIEIYEKLLKNMKKHKELSYVFDVKGDEDAFYKYFDKFFERLAEKRKMVKTRDFIYVILLITLLCSDYIFWWRNINLFNIIFDAIFSVLVLLIFLYDMNETAKLTRIAEKVLLKREF
ncbi:MAG: hypothetical protein ACTSXW_07060 [Candidatus Baldrarchaeia archaeon]